MSGTTVTCNECGEHVPKKKFCGECGKLLAVGVNQPTTSQGDKASTPVQVSDSVSLEASKIANRQSTDIVNKQPTSSTTISPSPNEKTNGMPSSYADAAAVGSRPSGEGIQQNNQVGRVPNNGPAGSSGMAENVNVTETNNDGVTAMNVTGGASKANKKDSSAVTKSDDDIQVVFHVLIPISVWNWNEHSKVSIRFINTLQSKPLEWNEISPQCSECQWPRINACEISAFVYLPVAFLSKSIPYKYVIYSTTLSNGMWEYIHDLSGHGTFNRCLELNQSSSDQRLFHVYDGFVFPHANWWNKINSYFSDTGIGTKESHAYALMIFLKTVTLSMSGFDITRAFEKVSEVYYHLRQKKYLLYNAPSRQTTLYCTDQLDRGLHQWIMDTLQRVDKHQDTDSHIRTWSAQVVMVIASVMRSTGIKLRDNDTVQIMLSYLYLENDLCRYVVNQMDQSVRNDVASSVAHICSTSMEFIKRNGEPYWEWLCATPLLHRLQLQVGVTHNYMSVDPSSPNWGNQGLDRSKLKEFSECIQSKKMMKKLFQECDNHIKEDHLLLRLLVSLCSEDDIDVMLNYAPFHIVALRVADLWHSIDKVKQADKKIEVMIRIIDSITHSADGNSHWFYCTLLAAKRVLNKMINICTNALENIKVLYFALKCYLYALNNYASGVGNEAKQIISDHINDAQAYLRGWLRRPDVGFGYKLGGKNGNKIKEEVKLWNDVLKMPSAHLSSNIVQEWETKIHQVIADRTENLQAEVFIKIAVEICNSKESVHRYFSDIVWKSITSIMENDSLVKETQQLMDTKKDKPNTGTLFSSLLTYYHSKKEVNLTTLLNFPLWPEYLKHFASGSFLTEHFSEECVRLCNEAIKCLTDITEKLKEGTVTVQELKMLTSHLTQAVNLFSPKVVKAAANDMSFNVTDIIVQRNSEIQKFELYCATVRNLLKYCESITNGDIVELLQDGLQRVDSEEEYANTEICQLYEVINGEEVYAILHIDDRDVMEMLKPFTTVMEEYKTVISQNIWNNHLQRHSKVLSLSEVATKVWAPVFIEIQQLIEKFYSWSITLKEIDKHLCNISSQNLEQAIQTLVEGCNLCLDKTVPTSWISKFVISVVYYRDVCKAQSTARLVLAAKDVLMLEGNFEDLRKFSLKVFSQSDLTLKDLKQVEVCEVKSLKCIASNKRQMQFLQVLSRSQPFIEWLQKETKDVIELHNLIGLSMFENDKRTMDRIAKLHTVGSAIAPLIYGLKKTSGLVQFLKACEPVWEAVDKDHELCDSFEFCRKDLTFLKQMKDMQAPIEVGTFDKVKTILLYGEYCISCKYHQIFHSDKEIVKITIKDCPYSNQQYTLSDLKDLESKIILIRDSRASAVNGQGTESKLPETSHIANQKVSISSDTSLSEKLSSKEVDGFLDKFHIIVHIADTLLHLQQAGHPHYVEWSQSFGCNAVTQRELQDLNEQMKRDYQKWLNKVSSLRKNLYALNYFTCLQLLRISNEFHCLINNPNHEVSSKILLLLMSLSPTLTVDDIKAVTSTTEAHSIALRSLPTFTPPDRDESHCVMEAADVPGEIDRLNKAEKKIYLLSVNEYGFNPRMVLLAIRQYGSNEDDVLNWCFDPKNAEMFESKPKPDVIEEPAKPTNSKVDITNPVVQELIGLEFSESMAIEAVKKCGEDLTKCYDYCNNQTLLTSSAVMSDDTQVELSDDILFDADAPYEIDTTDAGVLESDSPEHVTAVDQETLEKPKFIDLEGAGMLLDTLAKNISTSQITRPFVECFEKGTPNFVSVSPCDIFKTVISIYAQGDNYKHLPLPSLEEVLICDHNTTVEEISLLWYRAIRDPEHKQIFCLVNGEKLPYQVCVEAFERMDQILTGETDYQLVIVCSNENKEERSYIAEHLQLSQRDTSAVMASDNVIHDFLNHHMSHNVQYEQQIFASEADNDKCTVRIIRARRTGMGKSLYVKRMTERLKKKFKVPVTYPLCVTIPIYGPNVDFDKVMKSLLRHANPTEPFPQIFHFDVAPSVLEDVDALLFSILILKGLNDSNDNVWRCFPQQLYLVEATYKVLKQDAEAGDTQNCNTIEFLKFIPTITCCSPRDAISHDILKKNAVYYDANEILSEQYQRPFQYLVRLPNPTAVLDTYTFSESDVTNDLKSFLIVVLKHFDDCGVTDPSWTELRHFLWFLNAQLQDCESSVFCKASYISDTLPGFKKFVAQFMLKMSKNKEVCININDVSSEDSGQYSGKLGRQIDFPILLNNLCYEYPSGRESLFHPRRMYHDFAVPSLRIAAVRKVGIINIGLVFSSPQPKSSDAVPANLSNVPDATPIRGSDNIPTDHAKFFTSTPTKSVVTNSLLELEESATTGSYVESSPSVVGVNNMSSTESRNSKDAGLTSVNTMVIEQYQIIPEKVWEYSFHPYIFFNKDHNSMTFIGFNVKNNGDLIDPATKKPIYQHLIPSDLLKGLKAQELTFTDDGSMNQEELLLKLFTVMGINTEILYRYPDTSYVLTADNTKKILAMLMRFRCNIPVVLMGETGCGKTRLIKYMCDLLSMNSDNKTLVIMKVHGGVTEEDIVREVTRARELAKKNAKDMLDTVMFFDEANTTEAIGLIKEIMCDNRIKGERIKENIKFIAACNPYRKHSPEMKRKLKRAGLGYYVHDTKQKLGNIPLRHLVYRVLELPSAMQSLVYDFGRLDSDTERDYAEKIVEKYVGEIPGLNVHKLAVTNILMACQNYMRERKDECSFVSLRDIERAMIVFEWFHLVLDHIEKDDLYKDTKCDRHTRALILAIAVCYYAKLQCREDFEKYIAPLLMRNTPNAPTIFKEEIQRCQEVFLNNMKIPQNVARNNALRENVFMMVVCIELKIPLFLVGKPGSSKSLAKSIVADSMQGAASSKPLFQKFKQIQLFSYQCSQHSTSETILEVFSNATKFQEGKKSQQYVSVVVLDEVGLAEDSPSLPLKTLHPLLEDGTTKSQDITDRVAFVGISNWALDPAKMNRGIMVTRDDPGIHELVLSARGICSSDGNDEVCKRLQCFFTPFAEAYNEICQEQEKHGKEFFGLRDFYSLIKMMYWISEETKENLTMNQLQHCLMRNFGGKTNVNETVTLFLKKVPAHLLQAIESASDVEKYDCTLRGLIRSSLQANYTSWHGENRYLLLLTENYSALRILEQTYLTDRDPVILFGSSFPEDINYTQVCRNINQIKFCMDTGRTVVLLNLEHLYASLYDVLNQYYITWSGTRYVDLGLQSHRIKCRVHPHFKLVLIADKDKVYKEFPTPLINRLEKHYLTISTILTKKQEKLMSSIEKWVKDFSKVSTTIIGADSFTPEDAFVGYQSDTPASIVFKVWQDFNFNNVELSDDDNQWEEKALLKSQEFLLKMATPDAIARSKHCELFAKWEEIHKSYFKIHSYSYLDDFVSKQLSNNSNEGRVIQITTHAPLLQNRDVFPLQKALKYTKDQVVLLTLQQFNTEIDFSARIRSVFQKESVGDRLLIIQCESGHKYTDLIACTRYRVLDERTQALAADPRNITHVVFIISLPRRRGGTKFVSFQGGMWECYHMDCLMPPKDALTTIQNALYTAINDILSDCYVTNTELLHKRLHNWISLSLLHSNNVEINHTVLERFNLLSHLIKEGQIITDTQRNQNLSEEPRSSLKQNDQLKFCEILLRHVFKSLKAKTDIDSPMYKQEWASREALNAEALHKSGSFINVLLLKLDTVVANVLGGILSAVDRYHNLHLLQFSEVQVVSSLWLRIFEDAEIILDLTNGFENSGFASFKCHFPFFWILTSSIESQWKIPAISSSKSYDVYSILKSKSIANKLTLIDSNDSDDIENLFQCYVHDFVMYSCGSSEYNEDTKIIEQIVCNEHKRRIQDTSDIDNILLYQIISFHEAYHNTEPQLHHLKQITTLGTDVSSRLQAYFTSIENDIGIDLYAVQELLVILQPCFRKWSGDDCRQWLRVIHNYQNTIDATIFAAIKNTDSSDTCKKIRRDWHLLRVLQIFVEHTIDYAPAVTIKIAMRMHKFLEKDHDFSKLTVYERLKTTIINYAGDPQINLQLSIRDKARNSCAKLFMEIISEIIFSASSTMDEPPEDKLVSELIKSVIPSTDSTQQLSPLTDSKADEVPVVRSYLLQLLLDYDVETVSIHLTEYFQTSHAVMKKDINFLVLCTQCFEDALHKKASNDSLLNAVQLTLDSVKQAKQCIFTNSTEIMTLDYVESVAKFRYALEKVACLLHDYYLDAAQFNVLSKAERKIIAQLLASVQDMCLAIDNDTNEVVPNLLIKCIVRKYGMSTLITLCNISKTEGNLDFSWLMPKHLQNTSSEEQEDKAVDPYVIYGKQYADIRNSLVTSCAEKAITTFKMLNMTDDNGGQLLLAVYNAITKSYLTDNRFDDKVSADLEKHIQSSWFKSDTDLAKMTSQLIYNFQACSSPLLAVNPERSSLHDQQLCAVVVHTVTVIMCTKNNSLLTILQHFVRSSSDLKKMYFPTMPHDELYENATVSKVGRMYKCINGHPFAVTECGRPTQLTKCPECSEPIGGQRHKLTAGNIEYKGEDATQTGHVLGPAQHLSKQATPERDLSPVACTIIRLIMHATLVWSSVCVAEGTNVLSSITHPVVKVKDLPQFFWQHLTRDLDVLSKVIGHSVDDAALLVHLILQGMYNSTYSQSNFDLITKESRRQWEQQLCALHIQPVLNDMDSRLSTAQNSLITDDRQAHNALLQVVYEKNTEKSPVAAMWRYRSRITFEHLEFFIEQQKSTVKCPILKQYLKEEVKLRATQYLPDIIHLQHILYKLYNYKVDEEEVSKLTVKDLQDSVTDADTFKKLTESFCKAWTAVKSFLPNYSRKRVPKELIIEVPNNPQEIPLVYFIPTKTGKGICSTALVDFLVSAHNDFINFYHIMIKIKTKEALSLRDLQSCYLVADKQQFMSVVMSHCHYSLTRGKGTEVYYDIAALERHFLSHFVHGRPLFDLRTAPIVIQCRNIHNSENFAAIRKNIHPQKPINLDTKKAIIKELCDSNKLREVLEIVNTILAILASTTTTDDPSRPIGQYAEELFKQKLPPKVKSCTLNSVISLWETLEVEQARRAVLANQDLFKDVGDDFKQQVNFSQAEETKFYVSLKKFHTDQLLGSLYQFIVLFVRNCSVNSKDWLLIDTFPEFLEQEQMDVPGLGTKFRGSMPKAITLSHVVDVWRKIVMYEAQPADK